MSDKIFSYGPSRRDRDLSAFRVVTGSHADLVRAVSSNPSTGYVVDKGSSVMIPRRAADDVSRHLIARGWSLGV